jgi:hypothetical protein
VRGPLSIALVLCALLVAGCGETKEAAAEVAQKAAPTCKYRAGWQKLANRVEVPVYCPGWLPDPLTAQIGGRWNNIDSVSKDRSWLVSFVWQETGAGAAGGELHVNLRGYPGRTAIPTCRTGGADSRNVACFRDPGQKITANGITAQLYKVNEDADSWHALLLWSKGGTMYTLSEHVAPPLTFNHVLRYLKQELASLVLIRPTAA